MKKHILLFSLVATMLASCSKDNDEPINTGNSSGGTEEPSKPNTQPGISVNGSVYQPNVGGPNQPNQVFIDLSTGEQTAVKRDTWDFAFYCGKGKNNGKEEFRVLLNSTIGMAAKELPTNNITLLQNEDNDVAPGPSTYIDQGYVDSPYGNFLGSKTGTAIKPVSVNDAENKVHLVNMGKSVGLETPELGSTNLDSGIHRGWKKIRVTINKDGDYVFQYAGLKESTYKEMIIKKDTNYNFVYINIEEGKEVKVQPEKAKWDISYTALVTYRSGGGLSIYTYFSSDIVIHNGYGVKVKRVTSQYGNIDNLYKNFTKISVGDVDNYFKINAGARSNYLMEIGKSWRKSALEGGGLQNNIFYVIKDVDGNLYKLKFLSMTNEKGERGYPTFEYELLK